MLQQNPRTELTRRQAGFASKQRGQLLIALSLLLIVLVVVLVKDRQFWFGSSEVIEAADASENVTPADSAAVPAKSGLVPVAPAVNPKDHRTLKAIPEAAVTEPSRESAGPEPPMVVTNRAVIPPLFVEVVAGDSHKTVNPGSNVSRVEIPSDSSRFRVASTSSATLLNASGHERLSDSGPDASPYPALGQHSRVQGSVVLQAVVGADGTIQDLRVISGPAILISAAQEAVRQWRFKPYVQNGQPVETVARITVNFSIRVQEDSSSRG